MLFKFGKNKEDDAASAWALEYLQLNRAQADALKKHYNVNTDAALAANDASRTRAGALLGAVPGFTLSVIGQMRGYNGQRSLGIPAVLAGSIFGRMIANKRYTPENADKILKGSAPDSDPQNLKSFGHVLEGVTGAALARNALTSGNLTGRQTLYHGTTKDAIKSIKEKGLLPTTAENAINTAVLKSDTDRFNKSLGKAYLTRDMLEAAAYAWGTATERGVNKKNWGNVGIAKINAPIWKLKTVINPEVDMPYKEWKDKTFGPFDHLLEMDKKFLYKNIGNAVVVDGGVGPEYVRGSDKYQRLTLKELGEYIKAKPKTFALGAAKTLGGLGMLGHGAYQIYDRAKQG